MNSTVLSEAVRGAFPGLVKRLVDEGADANGRIVHDSAVYGTPADVPPHKSGKMNLSPIASQHANLGALQVLLGRGDATWASRRTATAVSASIWWLCMD